MEVICRVLADDEHRTAHELGRVAFGGPRLAEGDPLPPRPGRILWGAFAAGRLVAVAGDRVQGQWFGGRLLAASGVSSVSVAPGERGKGYAQVLLTAVLAGARERGAVVSTLFPTAPALYRRLGWEETGVLTWWDLPTASLSGVRTPAGWGTRPATPEDRAAILDVYRDAAARSNGHLERDDDRFPGWPFHDDYGIDGVTLALAPDGTVSGFACWERGTGYGTEARLTVLDLIGRDAPATTALLASVASWGAVTPTVSMLVPRPDPLWWAIPTGAARVRSVWPWMTRVIDAQAAVESRGWPELAEGEIDLELTDDQCPWNAGRWTLAVAAGRGRLTRGGSGAVAIGARGLGVLFAGGATVSHLERAGLCSGAAAEETRLEQMFAGPAPATLNYF